MPLSNLDHIDCTDQVHLTVGEELFSLVVKDFDCIGNCTYNYHMITATRVFCILGCLIPSSLSLPIVIEVPVPSQECEWSCICVLGISTFYDFSNGFWVCSDRVVLFVFHFNISIMWQRISDCC